MKKHLMEIAFLVLLAGWGVFFAGLGSGSMIPGAVALFLWMIAVLLAGVDLYLFARARRET